MKQPILSKLRNHWQSIFFALRATTAAISSVATAELFNLDCPYWAALTALIVMQPTRGMVLEKSVYRLVGTGIGSLVGLLMLLNLSNPLTLTLTLALWLGLCIAISCFFHGLRSYGCIMAGITCAILTMSGSLRGGDLYEIAFSRVACICIGIIIATFISAFFTPKRSLSEVTRHLDRLGSDILTWLSWLFRSVPEANREKIEQELLSNLVEIESLMDIAVAGTYHARHKLTETTAMFSELMNLLGIGCMLRQQRLTEGWNDQPSSTTRNMFAIKLEQLAAADTSDQARQYLHDLHDLCHRLQQEHPSLTHTLDEILTSLHTILYQRQVLYYGQRRLLEVNRHNNWREGLRSALRVMIVISCAGIFWQTTGWHLTPLLIMALSIMLTLFASKEHPTELLKHILTGAVIGASAAIVCRLALLGADSGATREYLIMVPFIFLGGFGMTHKKTAIASTDATFIFLLTLQPGLTTDLKTFDLLFGAVAMLAGISCSWLAYRFLFPINPAIRMNNLLNSISQDIRNLALDRNPEAITRIEAKLRHKIIRLVALAQYQPDNYHSFVNGGLTALSVMTSFQQLRKQFAMSDIPETARQTLQKALNTIAESQADTTDVINMLEEIMETQKFQGYDPRPKQEITVSLHTAAQLLAENLVFLAHKK